MAEDDTASTDEDTAVNVSVLANDSDVDEDALIVDSVTSPAHGTVVIESDGTVTYTPDPDFHGTDAFTYVASDGNGGTDTATVTITINPVNDAPVAVDDTYSTDEDMVLSVVVPGVLTNDSDVDGDALTAVLVSDVANGTLTFNADGSFEYIPNVDFNGSDPFTYKANDGAVDSDVTTVTLTIIAVNDPPVADAGGPYGGTEGSPLVLDASGSSDVDSEVSYAWDLDNDGEYDDATGVGPTASFADDGTYIIAVRVEDDLGLFDTDEATVTVINVAPTVTVDEALVTVSEGSLATNTGTFGDVGADTVTLSASVGTMVDNGDGTWSWSFTPTDGPDQSQTVTITATDDDGATTSTTFDLIVVNVAPTVTLTGAASVDEGATYTVNLAVTDPGDDTVTGCSLHWGDGSPIEDCVGVDTLTHIYANGPDTFTVAVDITDDDGTYPTAATHTVDVTNVAPTVTADPASQTVQYSDAIAPVTISATDVATDEMTASVVGDLPDAFSLAAEPCDPQATTCTWTLTGIAEVPAGIYTITVGVTDDDGDTGLVDIVITVEPESAAVVFGDNPVAVIVDEPGSDSSERFELEIQVVPQDDGTPGDVTKAEVSVVLAPVGPGSGDTVECSSPDADGWVTCGYGGGLAVNTYTIEVTVNGGYYAGYAEDVLVVYDPSLGFTTGGGWFYWPGTDDPDTGYPGDKTNFGYTMKYNKKGAKVKGSLLLIRHLPDGTIYRVKSNALYGLALGEFEDGDETYGWASFSGKSTYLEPGWPEPIGNHNFIAYVEDRNEPGSGVDRVWIEVWDKEGNVIPVMSMSGEPDAASNAEEIGGGNLVVPHGAGGAKTK